MNELQHYYDEHASQARQHEDQRERMTNIVLAITAALMGLITFAEFALGALPASIAITLLGLFGFLFAGKHYERFRYHTAIMKQVRGELDHLLLEPGSQLRTLSALRKAGTDEHYETFRWPEFRPTKDGAQANARSWLARQRVHVFWELLHVLVAVIGLALTVAIMVVQLSK